MRIKNIYKGSPSCWGVRVLDGVGGGHLWAAPRPRNARGLRAKVC